MPHMSAPVIGKLCTKDSSMVYRVKWKELARHMVKQLFIILSVGFMIIMCIRLFSVSFDIEETFKHVSLIQLPLMFLAIFLFSLFFGVTIGYLFKCSYVTIENNEISGRNYWLLKRRFKMNEIEKTFTFNSNGMPVVVVDAGKKGQIFVPIHIEDSEELFQQLDRYA
jgi:purine-cytosine permease-like protein